MKKMSLTLSLVLILSLFAGCAGTPVVYYTDCTCPVEAHAAPAEPVTPMPAPTEGPAAEGSGLKTGLYIGPSIAESASASAEADGVAKYDVTVVAVLVDDAGIIHDCRIDNIPASVTFDASGVITSDISAAILSKNELGDNYGMRKASSIGKEWNEQAAAIAAYALGKNAADLGSIAISASGEVDADLASGATMYVGGYISAIQTAAANAQHLGAQAGDELRLAAIPSASSSTSAEGETAGLAQLNVDVTALTVNSGVITSCYIDALQAKVNFDASGVITTDLTAPVLTKNQLGDGYNMKTYGGAIAEWYEQAASFASYVTGKTAAEVSGIAVDESTHPTDADLVSSVTIAIGGFQALVAKAAQ